MRAALARGPTSVREYYAHAAVVQRVHEYCGDPAGTDEFSCISIAALIGAEGPRYRWELAAVVPPAELKLILERGADFARSLWDKSAFLFFLDLDYHNQDHPSEAFAHPIETFAKLDPVYRATRVLLRRFGIRCLTTLSGRGYHFVAQIGRESPVADALAGLCHEPPAWWRSYGERRDPWMPDTMAERDARVYVGLGKVTEHLAQLIQRRAAHSARIPVVLNGTAVGSGEIGRESVSIDLSHFGDPLDQRHVRCAFSSYQLHLRRPDIFGETAGMRLGPLVNVICTDVSLPTLARLRTTDYAIAQARSQSALLPDASAGISALMENYRRSPLAAFHQRYERELSTSAGNVAVVNPADVPACVAAALLWPNDLLLRPEYVQHVTRYFLACGWSAARVAKLVTSLYQTPGMWGAHWRRVDPQSRAEFDVRIFAGLHASGADAGIDFNCTSAQEKGLCPGGVCAHDLRRYRARLLERTITS